MTICTFCNDKTIEFTEAQFIVAYTELNRFDKDDKVTVIIGDYYIDMQAEDCYWAIVGALNRQIGRM